MLEGILGEKLAAAQIEFVLLCGFLFKVPVDLINQFDGRILNIHPVHFQSLAARVCTG